MKKPKSYRLSALTIKKLEILKKIKPDQTETEIVEEAIDLLLVTERAMQRGAP